MKPIIAFDRKWPDTGRGGAEGRLTKMVNHHAPWDDLLRWCPVRKAWLYISTTPHQPTEQEINDLARIIDPSID
jgi:hypothetical protein